jgi:hypothetical protein
MTLGDLRPFFAKLLTNLKYKEWPQAFAVDNIPANILTNSFHVAVGHISSAPAAHLVHEFKAPVTIRLFFKGYRAPNDAKDAALTQAHVILGAILKPDVRLTQEGLKDIRPGSITPVALAHTNDNSLILELVFECILNYRFT